MIKRIFVKIKGPHLFMSLIFLGLGLVVLGLSVRGYKEHSQKEIVASETAARLDSGITAEELHVMLGASRVSSPEGFEVVAEKNLFSPDRRAWQPPPPRDDQEEQVPARAQRVNPREFRLYGVTFSGDEKMALVYYQRLPENARNRLVSEGETVYHERDGGTEVFRVASIGTEAVTLEANGDSFEVGLFSHERQKIQTGAEDRISVVIGGTSDPVSVSSQTAPPGASAPGKPSPSPAPGKSLQHPQDSGAETPDEDSTDRPQPGSLPELLQRMRESAGQGGEHPGSQTRVQEMEVKVQEGTMRRIDTPFGPIYRPVE